MNWLLNMVLVCIFLMTNHLYPTAREIDGQWEPAVEPRSWARCSAMTQMVGWGWEGAHGEGHVCIQITAPHCCTVETSTTL